MNKITLIGNLTRDPEIFTTQNGISVCKMSIAVDRKKTAERQTDFFNIQAWRGLGDSCAKYLSKGKKIAVIGELQARIYEAKDGTTKMSLDVQADEVEFLSPKDEAKPDAPKKPKQKASSDDDWRDLASDDLPF